MSLKVTSQVHNFNYIISFRDGSSSIEDILEWDRLFFAVPDGVYSLNITGQRDDIEHVSGLALDDILIAPCDTFSELQ